MKILVTGGAGYIGSQFLIEAVRCTKWDLISIDNYSNSSPETFERIAKITGKNILNNDIDLRNKDKVRSVFKNNQPVDGIVHFAALKSVPESVHRPLLYYDNNINSLLNLLEVSAEFNIPYFIFSSSCSVYGNVTQLPVNEATPIGVAESPYAHTKQIGEGIIENFCKNSDCKAISLRYFNPVGADPSGLNGEDPINAPSNLLPIITQVASGILEKLTIYGNDYKTRDGTCIRDYIHVSDIALAHINAVDYLVNPKNKAHHEILNLGTGQGVTVMEVVNAFENVTGMKLNYEIGPRRAGDIAAVYSDTGLSEEKLRWKPRYDINEMMKSAWMWQLVMNQEGKR
jgi:UDP-glucose 4-epimerase